MKILISLIIFCSVLFGQVSVDSTKVEYSDNTTTLTGYATFVTTPDPSDYRAGFLRGTSYNDLEYIPMGSYSWNNSTKQLEVVTTITNSDVGNKYYYSLYIQPLAAISKYEVGGSGELPNIVCEPVISSQSANKSLTQPIGETITFTIIMEEIEDCSYNFEWQYLLDGQENWNVIANNNTGEWTTPSLQAAFNNAKVRCRIYNDSGETYSQTATIYVN